MLTNEQRCVWAYRFLGSAYCGGFTDDNGAYTGLDTEFRAATSNTDPFGSSYIVGRAISGGWGGFGAGGGSITYRGGTTSGGTLFASFVAFRLSDYLITPGTPAHHVYATNVQIWGTQGNITLEWTVGFPNEYQSSGPMTSAFADALMVENFYDVGLRPTYSFKGPHSATLVDIGGLATIVATLIATSISLDTFVATCVFRGSNTSQTDVNPAKVILMGTVGSAKVGMATLYKYNQDPSSDAHYPGAGWLTVLKNDIWLATFFFVC